MTTREGSAPSARRTTGVGPLSSVPFRWLLAARTMAALGNAIAPIALAFAVLDLTGSAADVGVVVAARSLAQVLLFLFGGVIADRFPRALVLVGSSLGGAVTQAVMAALVLQGSPIILLLAVLGVANGAVAAVALPASAALTPQTVPTALLQPANALLRMSMSGAVAVGAAVAGLLVAIVGPGWGIAADAVAFAVAGLFFSRVRVPDPGPERSHGAALRGVWQDLRVGWSEFVSRTWLWVVVLQFAVVNAAVAGTNTVLGPAVADETIGRSAWGLLVAGQTVGLIAGGLLAIRIRPRRLLAFGVACVPGAALSMCALASTSTIPLLLVAFFFAGLAIEQFGIAWDMALQENVPQDTLARVYAYDSLGSAIAIPAGQLLIGPLSQEVGARTSLVGSAMLVVTASALALSSRSVREVVRRPTTG